MDYLSHLGLALLVTLGISAQFEIATPRVENLNLLSQGNGVTRREQGIERREALFRRLLWESKDPATIELEKRKMRKLKEQDAEMEAQNRRILKAQDASRISKPHYSSIEGRVRTYWGPEDDQE